MNERSNGRLLVAAMLVAVTSTAWLDPHARTREANRLYDAGKYDDAAAKYNEALVDHPDSSLLHFNLGDAQYKQGKYDDALAAFQQVRPSDDDRVTAARTAYNVGNTTYRVGEALAATDPQKALERYAEALVAYRRAITAAPDDLDAKLNYELVTAKRDELQKKLDEQRQQQQQQNQDQQNQQQQNPQQDQRDQGQQQEQQQEQDQAQRQQGGDDQQRRDQQHDAERRDAQQAAAPDAQPSPASDAQQPRAAEGGTAADAERREGEMTRQEATALLDAQRAQEVPPGDVVRRLQGGVVAEPSQDW